MLEFVVQTNKEPIHRRMMFDTFVGHLDITGKSVDLPHVQHLTKYKRIEDVLLVLLI